MMIASMLNVTALILRDMRFADSDLQEVKPIYEGYDLTLDDDRNGYLNAGFLEDEDEPQWRLGWILVQMYQ